MPTEAPTQGDIQGDSKEAMSVAALINEWDAFDGRVYGSYAILDAASADASAALVDGAEPIVSARPVVDAQLNWLNVFYSVEWVVFAGFALFIWWRMVKDDYQRGLEDELDDDHDDDTPPSQPTSEQLQQKVKP